MIAPIVTLDTLRPTTSDSNKILLERIAEAQSRGLVELGSFYISAGESGEGGQSYSSFTPQVATVFATLTGMGGSWAGKTFAAGVPVNGIFTAITVTSGAIVATRM